MMGVAPNALHTFEASWQSKKKTPQTIAIKEILDELGYQEESLYISVETSRENNVIAYIEPVAMALLEYYALISKSKNQHALDNYRRLVRKGFRQFIYEAVNYHSPSLDGWRNFHDRVNLLMNSVPEDYFSIFHEIEGLAVLLIDRGIPYNPKTIYDISVGRTWSAHWSNQRLASLHGDRVRYEHNYPEYYPQANSNPQHPWAYPDTAIPEFRRWFRRVYLPSKLPPYLMRTADTLALENSAKNIIEAVKAHLQATPKLPKSKEVHDE